jgi:HK97 family phage major capsid protein
MSIILRKVGGVLTPLMRRNGRQIVLPSVGGHAQPGTIFGALFGLAVSPLVLALLAFAFAVAWSMAHPAGLHGALGIGGLGAFSFMGPTELVERREELQSKQKTAVEVLELAGKDIDLSRKPVLEKLGATDAADALVKFQALNKECETLGADLAREELKMAAKRVRERDEEMRRPADEPQHSGYDESGAKKSWGQQFIESKAFRDSRQGRVDIPFEMEIGVKTLFETAAGYAIENVRSGLLVEKATRPIQVIDLIPSFPIGQSSFVYMEETTSTHASAERAEGTAYPESTFVWTQRTSPVQKIADSIPVTDEQLEDEQQVKSLLEQRLSFGVRQRLDLQVLVGNGTSPNLRGINNVSGIQTQAKGADSGIVAFLRAMTLVRFTGRANPSGAVFHPNDWLDIMLTQSTAGEFLFGNPFQGPGPTSLFGVSIAQSDAQTEDSALVGDFVNFSRLDDRRGVRVQTGYVGSQFTEGKVTLRADLRAAFTVTRPAAFVQITGL